MRKMMWLLNGVALGFIAAHLVNKTPEGRRFFDRVNRGVEEFSRAFSAGYHEADSGQMEASDASDAPAADQNTK